MNINFDEIKSLAIELALNLGISKNELIDSWDEEKMIDIWQMDYQTNWQDSFNTMNIKLSNAINLYKMAVLEHDTETMIWGLTCITIISRELSAFFDSLAEDVLGMRRKLSQESLPESYQVPDKWKHLSL